MCLPAPALPPERLLLPVPIEPELEISADRADVVREGLSRLEGNVEIRGFGRLLTADRAEYDSIRRQLRVEGAVEYSDDELTVLSQLAEVDADEQRIRFSAAQFALPERPARGGADELEVRADRTIRLADVLYTSCPQDNEDWRLRASSIRLDADSGFGTGRHVRLDFLGFPILYTPWITFPITDQRKTGFLFPQFRRSNRTGEDVSIPFYVNLAPNYDATLTPRGLTRRGVMLDSEFRYMTPRSQGLAEFDWLPSDRQAHRDRHLASLSHRTWLSDRWRVTAIGAQVSDAAYFEDLSGGVSATSQTHLNRRVEMEYAGERLQLLGRFQGYQTIDDTILPENRPYRHLPQIALQGDWPELWMGLDVELQGELARFDRSVGVTGWRLNTQPTISRRFGPPGLFVRPAVAVQHTRYQLGSEAAPIARSPQRTLPMYSLDLGAQLERGWRNGELLQTLEPRVQYLYVPFRDQDQLPIFDTIEPDFGLMQLFRFNRYLGPDRVQNADQVTLGMTTRIVNESTGEERMHLSLGQAYQLSDQRVDMDGAHPLERGSAEYVGELGVLLARDWRLNLGYHWHSDLAATSRTEAGVQYRPDDQRVVHFSYRFRRGALEQADAVVSWPVAPQWNVVARYNYSLRDETPLDRFLGLEYEACCFALRMAVRRQVVRRTGDSDTSIALQIELRGLASVGEAPADFLERGIIGYDR